MTPEQEGVIVLSGGNGALELSVSPTNRYATESRINGFLAGSEPRLRLWLASNWQVAVIVQSVVMLPAVLILFSLACDIAASTVVRVGRRAWTLP